MIRKLQASKRYGGLHLCGRGDLVNWSQIQAGGRRKAPYAALILKKDKEAESSCVAYAIAKT